MPSWSFPLALDPRSETPLFLQIARAIAGDIRRGRLRPGDRLPSSRSLALTLDVHRNTVLAAYRELEAQGVVSASGRRGTRVQALPSGAAPLPLVDAGDLGFPIEPWGYPLATFSLQPGLLSLSGGLPNVGHVPIEILARAYRRALRTPRRANLTYGDPRGERRLRRAIATMLSELRGLTCTEEQILVTRGSQMALDLLARALVRPGDAVAVENPGYPMAWEVFRMAGARLVPLPVDADGLQVEALEALDEPRLRAVFVTPQHQYPATVALSDERRARLIAFARRWRVAVIEDDYDFEFQFEGHPRLPLASADEAAGVVVYIGSFSKILAPGLRLGFIAASAAIVEALAPRRFTMDLQGDHVLERAVAELIEDEELQRHARRMRRAYHANRDVLAEALRAQLGGVVDFDLPEGGMCLWLRVAETIDVDAWAERGLSAGVQFFPGRNYEFARRPIPRARVGYASNGPADLRECVARMTRAL